MKVKVLFLATALLLGSMVLLGVEADVPASIGTTYYVGGIGPGNESSINDAIALASAGDTIRVYDGVYNEKVYVNKTLNLIGNGTTSVITFDDDIMVVNADWTNITGFKYIGTTYYKAGINIKADNVSACGCNFTNTHYALKSMSTKDGRWYNNTFLNCSVYLYMISCRGYWVHNCSGYNSTWMSAYLNSVKGSEIHNCTFVHGETGINGFSLDGVAIENNTLIDHDESIKFSSAGSLYLRNNTMVGGGIEAHGWHLPHFENVDIDTSNTVNSDPVYYWVSQSFRSAPLDTGELILVDCNNIDVGPLNLSDRSHGVFCILSNNVTMTEITAHNCSRPITVSYSEDVEVLDCDLRYCSSDAIYISGSDRTNITDMYTYGCNNGIYSYGAKNLRVERADLIMNSGYGFREATGGAVFMNSSVIDHAGTGFQITTSTGSVIENTTVRNCTSNGLNIQKSSWTRVQNCIIENNVHSGIVIAGMGSHQPALHNTVSHNLIRNNLRYGIEFWSHAQGNHIHHNNFIDNVGAFFSQGYDGGGNNKWNFSMVGNHWSDWTEPDNRTGSGQDLPGWDGIVDVPYSLAGDSEKVDSYPMKYPFGAARILDEINPVVDEDVTFSQNYSATEVDVEWTLETDASWLSMPTDGHLYGIPDNSDVGEYYVSVTIFDGLYYDNKNVTVSVHNVNDDPEINGTDVLVGVQGVEYHVEYTASDIDPTMDEMSWSLDTNATFLSLVDGVLSGVPTNDDIGVWFVNVTLKDGRGGLDHTSFMLTINDSNDAPELVDGMQDIVMFEDAPGVQIDLSEWFEDIDGDELDHQYSSDEGVTCTLVDSIVTIVPDTDFNGIVEMMFTANDTIAECSTSVNVSVISVDDAPVVDIVVNGSTVRGVATDGDIAYGDVLEYNWSSNISGSFGDGSVVLFNLCPGTHQVTLVVTDSTGLWDMDSVEIVVDAPVVNMTEDNDTDADGLLDEWEMMHFADLSQGPAGDPDADGASNAAEFLAGTDPTMSDKDYTQIVVIVNQTSDGSSDGQDGGDNQTIEPEPEPEEEFVGSVAFYGVFGSLLAVVVVVWVVVLVLLLVLRKKEEPAEDDGPVDEGFVDVEPEEGAVPEEEIEVEGPVEEPPQRPVSVPVQEPQRPVTVPKVEEDEDWEDDTVDEGLDEDMDDLEDLGDLDDLDFDDFE